jgi:hypothetical protein
VAPTEGQLLKLPPRLEQAGDERSEQMKDGKHHAG